MAWEIQKSNRRKISQITIRKNVIAFSAYFIKKEKLDKKGCVQLLIEPKEKKIGFIFHDNEFAPKGIILCGDGGGYVKGPKYGRAIRYNLSKEKWVNEVLSGENASFKILKGVKKTEPEYYVYLNKKSIL